MKGGFRRSEVPMSLPKDAFRHKADVEGELLRMLAKTIYAAKVSTLAS